MIDHSVVLWTFFVTAGAYPVVMRILARLAEPQRQKMLALADELVVDARLNAETREYVQSLARDACDWKFMATAAVFFPAFLLHVCTERFARRSEDCAQIAGSEETGLDNFMWCHAAVAGSANPFFALIVLIEVGLLALVLVAVESRQFSLSRIRSSLGTARRMFSSAAFRIERQMTHLPFRRA